MNTIRLRLPIGYSQFTLEGGGWDPDQVAYTGGNGLAWATDAAVVVMTGVDSGHVPVTIGIGDRRPVPDLDKWDEAVEVGITVAESTLVICSPPGECLEEVPIPAGTYRMRIHARGRDAGREAQFIDNDAGEPMVEEHLILLWPAALAEEERLKATDTVGAENRGQA
ncbi:hypothetical protein [Actinoallomurus sp. NPDC050550]|uniref:hypothetical protein n=1 Tax=Actinoallomurus sp. NPDC050550 TaxID=3154937 RepID=UPI0033DF8486